VRNKEVLPGVKDDRNSLYTVKERKDNWIDHVLHRHIIEGKIEEGIEVTGR
jgi:hypothetical protein